MENKRFNKGITLIALVITIIVLIILASITITTLTGENGIITKTNEAKFKTEMAELKEQLELFNVDKLSENSDYLESTLTAGKELLEYNTKKPGETGNIYTIFTSIRRRTQRQSRNNKGKIILCNKRQTRNKMVTRNGNRAKPI